MVWEFCLSAFFHINHYHQRRAAAQCLNACLCVSACVLGAPFAFGTLEYASLLSVLVDRYASFLLDL